MWAVMLKEHADNGIQRRAYSPDWSGKPAGPQRSKGRGLETKSGTDASIEKRLHRSLSSFLNVDYVPHPKIG